MNDQAAAIKKMFSDGWKKARSKYPFHNTASTEKTDATFVTEIDLYLEEYFINELQKLFPEKVIISEETAINTTSLELIHLDPLDGTHNFISNSAPFGSMLSIQSGTEIIFSAIYDPLRDLFYWAEAGKGAYLENTRFTYNPDLHANKATLLMEGKTNQTFAAIVDKLLYQGKLFRSIRKYGCMLPPVTYASSGWLHTLCVLNSNPYDIFPAAGILQEAGFIVLTSKATPWKIGLDDSVIITTPEFAEKLKELLRESGT